MADAIIKLKQGSYWEKTLKVYTSDGDLYSFSSYSSVAMEIRRTPQDKTAIATVTCAFVSPKATSGEITLILTSDQTADIPSNAKTLDDYTIYFGDVFLTSSTGIRTCLCNLELHVIPEVTRS